MLAYWDLSLFYFINQHHSPFWDEIMFYVSETFTWIPVAIILLWSVWRRITQLFPQKKKLLFVLFVVCASGGVGLANTLTSEVLKPIVKRYRPCQKEANLPLPVHIVHEHCGGKFGFASSHAANFFAAATFLALFFKNRRATIGFLIVAVLVSLSRVYLGVHYPSDVFAGGIIGVVCAYLAWKIWLFFCGRNADQDYRIVGLEDYLEQ